MLMKSKLKILSIAKKRGTKVNFISVYLVVIAASTYTSFYNRINFFKALKVSTAIHRFQTRILIHNSLFPLTNISDQHLGYNIFGGVNSMHKIRTLSIL